MVPDRTTYHIFDFENCEKLIFPGYAEVLLLTCLLATVPNFNLAVLRIWREGLGCKVLFFWHVDIDLLANDSSDLISAQQNRRSSMTFSHQTVDPPFLFYVVLFFVKFFSIFRNILFLFFNFLNSFNFQYSKSML